MSEQIKRGAIARKLIIFVVLFSSAITLLTTAIQLYVEYDQEVRGIERSFSQIETSYLQSLSTTVWVADNQQLKVMIEGIRQLPDIVRVKVSEISGVTLAESGKDSESDTLSRSFDLIYQHRGEPRTIGYLNVVASLSEIYSRLIDRVLLILVSNGIKTFAVAIFIFFVFSYMVTRHLGALADYARRLTPGRLDETLTLDRSRQLKGISGGDELDDLADAINEMRERLRGSYRAIEESEIRFRQLAENIREVFWIGSPDWKTVYYVSSLYVDVWERPVEHLYRDGGAWQESVHPNDKIMFDRVVAEKIESGCADPVFPDYRIVLPDGGVRWIRARAFPVRDGDGTVVRIAGIAEDITRRRTAEQALRESERRYRSIVETSAEGYWLVDAEGRTLEVNDALCRMLGFERDDFLDRRPITFVADHAQADFKRHFDRRDVEEQRTYDAVYRAKDGSDVHVNISASTLFDRDGERLGSFAFITDITEQKRSADELRRIHGELERRVEERTRELLVARNRAVAADRAKSEFLANMSHELRTPLNAVIGFSDVIIQRVFGEVGNPRYEEYIRLINESGIHLLDLISDLLDVSAIEAGRMEMQAEPVSLADVIPACMRLIRDRAATSMVVLESKVSVDKAPVVMADTRRMKQILINLLTNAVKFTPVGGNVTISAEQTEGDRVSIHISDTGIGMSEDELTHVLEPFTRTQAAADGHFEGTGLGLPLVNGLVTAHGGTLTLKSEVGVGTTATITLPAAPSRLT